MPTIIRPYFDPTDALTVTNLHSLPSSTTFLNGWASNAIDLSSDPGDLYVTAQLQVASSGLSAGAIRMYAVGLLDDSNWPDVFSSGTEGTEGAVTVHDSEILEACFKFLGGAVTDTAINRKYPIGFTSLASVFDGIVPAKAFIYIAQSTGQNLASSGNVINVRKVQQEIVNV